MMNQKSNHTVVILALIAALTFGASLTSAQAELPTPLSRKLATHLIAEFFEYGKSDVKVAYILNGKLKKTGFEADCAAEVTYLSYGVVDGRRRRMVQTIRFQHDSELGWFLQVIVKEEGRDFIDICSEHQGRIRIE